MKENNRIEELKEIALELLQKYEDAEESNIWERSTNIDEDLNVLEIKTRTYREKIINI